MSSAGARKSHVTMSSAAISSARPPSRPGFAHTSPRGRIGGDSGASLGWGIGGSRNSVQLKCLHAHVAFGLAVSDYVLGARILAEVDEPWPSSGCCSAGDAR